MPVPASTPTRRRCRCWRRARRRRAGCGPSSATTGRSAAPIRRPPSTSIRRIAAARTPSVSSTVSPASCRRMRSPGSAACTSPIASRVPITEAACWAHARRGFFELAELKKAPIAIEAVKRIDALFDIEREINGFSADQRLAVRAERSRPLVVRARGLAAPAARQALGKIGDGEGDRLPAEALGRLHPLPRRRPDLHLEQRRRAGAARHRRRPEELDLRRLRRRRPPRRRDVHPDRDGEAERHRPPRLARRRPRPPARPPGPAHRRTAALELAEVPADQRRRITDRENAAPSTRLSRGPRRMRTFRLPSLKDHLDDVRRQ